MARSGGFLHGNHQAFAEAGQRFLQPVDFSRYRLLTPDTNSRPFTASNIAQERTKAVLSLSTGGPCAPRAPPDSSWTISVQIHVRLSCSIPPMKSAQKKRDNVSCT